MRREWLLPMLEKGAVGVPGSFDSIKGDSLGRGAAEPPRLRNVTLLPCGKALDASELWSFIQMAFPRRPTHEQRTFWPDRCARWRQRRTTTRSFEPEEK
jgi:hypothetical protein